MSKEFFLRARAPQLEWSSHPRALSFLKELKSKLRFGTLLVKRDTSPLPLRKPFHNSHYRRAIGALVVYDLGKRSSFDNCEKWIQDVKEQADPDITIMLVGNKLDKAEQSGREVTEAEGREFAASQKILFKETSALENTNVEGAFVELLERIDENR